MRSAPRQSQGHGGTRDGRGTLCVEGRSQNSPEQCGFGGGL